MRTQIDKLHAAHKNRERDIAVRLSAEEQTLKREQQRAATIVARHADVARKIEKVIKKTPAGKAPKYVHLRTWYWNSLVA